ncbi:hypothetical protein PoB_000077500 [Plakobranchus ocellatus]|uniref:Uncharacterized protein n=1 Tax=Plakobranchus ocellatus TaxID=259542 RepID=A0AAV3XTP5_9GAST|nr:hypothetical protein PoB_000077500 [Plakobranchus ocellatus]
MKTTHLRFQKTADRDAQTREKDNQVFIHPEIVLRPAQKGKGTTRSSGTPRMQTAKTNSTTTSSRTAAAAAATTATARPPLPKQQ